MLVSASHRCCARCGRPLTDPVSRDCGVGPVCRGMDNAMLAQLLPAQPAAAVLAFGGIDPTQFPPDMTDEILSVASALSAAHEGEDLRKVVRRIERLASFVPAKSRSRRAMHETLVALGYLTLAAAWLGDVSTGDAIVSIEGDRLYLQGPKNKGGIEAFRKIPGRQFHPGVGGDRARWSCPASEALMFRRVVLTHWPMAEGLPVAMAGAEAYVKAAKEAPAAGALPPAPPVTPTVTITPCTGGFEIRSPYSAQFVSRLKAEIPYKGRAWNGIAKAWTVAAEYIDKARAIALDVYGPNAVAA